MSASDTQWLRINRRLRPDSRPRAIIVRVSGLVARVEIGSCAWCAGYGKDRAICSACGDKADRARASLRRTAAKRNTRRVESRDASVTRQRFDWKAKSVLGASIATQVTAAISRAHWGDDCWAEPHWVY